MSIDIRDFTFQGLRNRERPNAVGSPCLSYLVSLADSSSHAISDTLAAKRILSWLYEIEEQAMNAEQLKDRQQQFFGRFFQGGFYPQTPCMVVEQWSPISAMLERGMEPIVVRREEGPKAVATGIWEPPRGIEESDIEAASTDEGLFWAIMAKVADLASKRSAWISVIAQPGFDRASAVNSLPQWRVAEVANSGRILWKRTAEG